MAGHFCGFHQVHLFSPHISTKSMLVANTIIFCDKDICLSFNSFELGQYWIWSHRIKLKQLNTSTTQILSSAFTLKVFCAPLQSSCLCLAILFSSLYFVVVMQAPGFDKKPECIWKKRYCLIMIFRTIKCEYGNFVRLMLN